jgi:O-methyltransferase domain/Dimerisation domain
MSLQQTPEMLKLINGFQVSRAIYVAAKLGLADLVCAGGASCETLAAATDSDPAALHRVIRVLASVGVFDLQPDGRVDPTELSRTLLTDAPGSLRGWAVDQLGGEHYKAWGELLHSVRTGEVAFEQVFSKNAWDHRAENPQSAKEFDEGMASFIGAHNQSVLDSYPFGNFENLYDLGGGDGQFITSALTQFPNLRGTLFEQPHVAHRARQRLHEAGLDTRCEVVDGDLFDSVPKGGAIYLLSRVIHDWNDDLARQILTVCRSAMGPKSLMLLVERVLPDRMCATATNRALAVSDLNMLVMTGGRERTRAQFKTLLESAGFSVRSVRATNTALSVIEAQPH